MDSRPPRHLNVLVKSSSAVIFTTDYDQYAVEASMRMPWDTC